MQLLKFSSRIGVFGLVVVTLSACASAPEIRPMEGPIVLDAPDAVVRSGTPAPQPASTPPPPISEPSEDTMPSETVQPAPVTPINCPAGTNPQPDGSCMLIN